MQAFCRALLIGLTVVGIASGAGVAAAAPLQGLSGAASQILGSETSKRNQSAIEQAWWYYYRRHYHHHHYWHRHSYGHSDHDNQIDQEHHWWD